MEHDHFSRKIEKDGSGALDDFEKLRVHFWSSSEIPYTTRPYQAPTRPYLTLPDLTSPDLTRLSLDQESVAFMANRGTEEQRTGLIRRVW